MPLLRRTGLQLFGCASMYLAKQARSGPCVGRDRFACGAEPERGTRMYLFLTCPFTGQAESRRRGKAVTAATTCPTCTTPPTEDANLRDPKANHTAQNTPTHRTQSNVRCPFAVHVLPVLRKRVCATIVGCSSSTFFWALIRADSCHNCSLFSSRAPPPPRATTFLNRLP